MKKRKLRVSLYKEERPWGNFEILLDGKACKVKKITVNPGERISLQSHSKRNEHWTVTEGVMRITVDDKVADYTVDDHIYIPKNCKHRIENTTKEPVALIEIQTGEYFGEDDIIRYADDYNRM